MEYQYKKAMEEHELTYGKLPEDAQTGIDQIKDIEKAISMLEKNGKSPTEKTMKKIRAMDKWVYYEILDFVHDTDKNKDDMPFEEKQIIAEIKDEQKKVSTDEKLTDQQKTALEIEQELARMLQTGKKQWESSDIDEFSPVVFNAIYETYHQNDAENGIETTRYSLIESEPSSFTFNLKKK
jgi:hypothetical protein